MDDNDLTKAVEDNNSELVRSLVQQGANILAKFPDGSTYLHLAVKSKSLDVMPTLVQLGIPVDSETTFEHCTPMEEASKTDDVNIMKILKLLGANIFWEDCDRETFLHNAAFYGANNAIDWLLRNGLDLSGNACAGSPILSAARGGHVSTVKKFLDLGVDVDTESNGFTALHWAAWMNHHDVLLLLLKHGGNMNARNESGNTPLHWAVENGSAECVGLLIDHGANINEAGDKGDTPLHWVAENGNLDACRELLNRGANFNISDEESQTPLCLALKKNQMKIVKELLSRGANSSSPDNENNDALRYVKSHI